MRFLIAKTSLTTGNILERLVKQGLQEAGIAEPPTAIICYGRSTPLGDVPALNARCSLLDKMEQGQRLFERMPDNALPICVPPFREYTAFAPFPWLARKRVHSRGRDIMPVLESWQIAARIAAGAEFFTPYLPSIREFRTWVYRKRHLGTYEKMLTEPERFTKLGRNRANGFTFSHRESDSVPQPLKEVACRAVAVLDLDFGAVDILETPDHQYKVLEVNSAPGVSDEHRRVIQGLAHRIVRWVANGCPERRNGS